MSEAAGVAALELGGGSLGAAVRWDAAASDPLGVRLGWEYSTRASGTERGRSSGFLICSEGVRSRHVRLLRVRSMAGRGLPSVALTAHGFSCWSSIWSSGVRVDGGAEVGLRLSLGIPRSLGWHRVRRARPAQIGVGLDPCWLGIGPSHSEKRTIPAS